jgi:hypothetical protein
MFDELNYFVFEKPDAEKKKEIWNINGLDTCSIEQTNGKS